MFTYIVDRLKNVFIFSKLRCELNQPKYQIEIALRMRSNKISNRNCIANDTKPFKHKAKFYF